MYPNAIMTGAHHTLPTKGLAKYPNSAFATPTNAHAVASDIRALIDFSTVRLEADGSATKRCKLVI